MINTLAVGSDGYINTISRTLNIGVQGYLSEGEPVVTLPEEESKKKKSSSSSKTNIPLSKYEYLKQDKFDYRVYSEEEEIMLLIKIFLRCQ